MAEHVLVESRGRRDLHAFAGVVADAHALLASGHRVRLALVDDGAGVTVGPEAGSLRGLLTAGGTVWADAEALAVRAIDLERLNGSIPGLQVGGIDDVSGWLLDDAVQLVWH